VKQIRSIDRAIRLNFGRKIVFSDGEIFYTFPKPEVLAELTVKKLRERGKLGYRAEYITNAAKLVLSGDLNLIELKDIPTSEAREILKTQVKGIGDKVADIILLYGLGKSDAFPMDRWIRRALIREYFKGKRMSDGKLRDFAIEYFREHAGVAHLYIFSYERKKVGR
jgi:N-glycosylase/DNA lyase